MKFLHCSDIHLGRRPVGGVGEYSKKRYEDYFNSFQWVAETAILKRVDLLLITGDLFDRRELQPEVLERTEAVLEKLQVASIPILAIEGNHDNIVRGKEHESWLIYLEKKGYLKRPAFFFGDDGKIVCKPITVKGVPFYGIGYPGFLVDEVIQELPLPENSTDELPVLLVHTAVSATDFIPGTVLSDSIDSLKGKVQYIAGGHLHSYRVYPQDDPYFFVPGSPEYWDFGERGSRGVILYDTKTKTHEFITSQPRKMLILNLETAFESDHDFLGEIDTLLNDANISKGESMVLLTLLVTGMQIPPVAMVKEYIEKKFNPLRLEVKVSYGVQVANTVSGSLEEESVDSVEERVVAAWDEFGINSHITCKALQKMKIAVKEKRDDALIEEMDHFLETLIGGGHNEN